MAPKKRNRKSRQSSSSGGSESGTPETKRANVFSTLDEESSDIELVAIVDNYMDKNKSEEVSSQDDKAINEIETDKLSDRELLLQISADMKEIKNQINGLTKEVRYLKAYQEQHEEDIGHLKTKVAALDNTCQEQSALIANLQNDMARLKSSQVNDKCYSMRNNLIFKNVPYEPPTTLDRQIRRIFEKMGLQNADSIRIERVHRLYTKGVVEAPVIVRFAYFPDRANVWRAKSKLKGTRIIVDEHFPDEILGKRRRLLPIVGAMRKEGKRVQIIKDYVVYNGKRYTVDNVSDLLLLINSTDPGANITDDVYAFLGMCSPLSNFYPCTFTYDGISYKCVEMGYQSIKAEYGGQQAVANRIRASQDPVEMKRLGDRVSCGDWYDSGEAIRVMTKLVREKFSQCDVPKSALINTGTKKIAEANAHNKFWGIGLSKFDKDTAFPDKWCGQNMLGKILQSIRGKITG